MHTDSTYIASLQRIPIFIKGSICAFRIYLLQTINDNAGCPYADPTIALTSDFHILRSWDVPPPPCVAVSVHQCESKGVNINIKVIHYNQTDWTEIQFLR
jgi:hypothetical protein